MKRRTEPAEVISPLNNKKKKFEELGLNLSSTSDDDTQCSNPATQGATVAEFAEETKGKIGIKESVKPPKKQEDRREDLETSVSVADVAEKTKGKTGIQESRKPLKKEDGCVEDLKTKNPEPTLSPATFVSDISIASFNTPICYYDVEEVHDYEGLDRSDDDYENAEPTMSPATFVSDISIASFNDDDEEVLDYDRLDRSDDDYYDYDNPKLTLSPATSVSDISIASFNTPISDDDEEVHNEAHDYDGPYSSDEDCDDDYIFLSTY